MRTVRINEVEIYERLEDAKLELQDLANHLLMDVNELKKQINESTIKATDLYKIVAFLGCCPIDIFFEVKNI